MWGRLSDRYEWVRIAIADYIDEEKGHQEWILNDIRVCGGDAQAVRNNQGVGQVSTPIELMVAYLYHQIDRAIRSRCLVWSGCSKGRVWAWAAT